MKVVKEIWAIVFLTGIFMLFMFYLVSDQLKDHNTLVCPQYDLSKQRDSKTGGEVQSRALEARVLRELDSQELRIRR